MTRPAPHLSSHGSINFGNASWPLTYPILTYSIPPYQPLCRVQLCLEAPPVQDLLNRALRSIGRPLLACLASTRIGSAQMKNCGSMVLVTVLPKAFGPGWIDYTPPRRQYPPEALADGLRVHKMSALPAVSWGFSTLSAVCFRLVVSSSFVPIIFNQARLGDKLDHGKASGRPRER